MNKNQYFKICLLLAILPFARLEGQQYSLRNITVQDGLSQNTIYTICQDDNGFMWFGTFEGLNRYDGYEFKTFQNDPLDTTSLSNNYVRSIINDQKGRLWVGTAGGLNLRDANADSFTHFFQEANNENSLISNDIHCLLEDNQQHIWIGTSAGISILNPETGQFRKVPQKKGPDGIPWGKILCFFKDEKGTVYIGTDGGLASYDETSGAFAYFDLGRTVYSIMQGAASDIWLGTSYGLYAFHPSDSSFSRYLPTPQPAFSNNNNIRTILSADTGHIWMGTLHGLYAFDLADQTFSPIGIPSEKQGEGLNDLLFMSSARDHFGNIWLGTSNKGIKLFHRNDQPFEKILPRSDQGGLKGSIVKSILEDSQGLLWIGTEDGGINSFDPQTKKWKFYEILDKNNQPFNNYFVQPIYEDSQGDIWIGSYSSGLSRLDKKRQVFSSYFKPERPAGKVNVLTALGIYEDKSGVLWVSTEGQYGLLQFSRDQNQLTSPPLPDPINKKLSGRTIWVIQEDQQGNLWLGDRYNGLFMLDKERRQLQHFVNIPADPSSLSHNTVLCIMEDSKNRVWVGTEGGGVNRYDPSTGKFVRYRKKDGLPSDVVHAILEDDQGALWMSTNKGIAQFDPDAARFQVYDNTDGLQTNQFHYNAAAKGRSGKFYFGGVKGVTAFFPDQIAPKRASPEVIITRLNIANQEAKINDTESPLSQSISETSFISLKNNQSIFSFNFVALNYSYPEKVRYAYQMEGLDAGWHTIGKLRTVTFTTLPAGDYTFKLRASLDGENWGPVKSIEVRILPPWWRSWWAYVIYGLLFALFLYGLVWFVNFKNLQKKKLELAQIEKDNLEKLNRLKLQFFTNISHELRTPLTLILGPLTRIIVQGGLGSTMSEQLKMMHRNASKLLELVNQLLDFRKQESQKLSLKVAQGNFVKFVKEIKLSFNDQANIKGIEYDFVSSSADIQACYDRDQMEKVFYNLLSNAFKFTPEGGKITVSVSQTDAPSDQKQLFPEGFLKVEVVDTGQGIPQENLDTIFHRFYQIEGSSLKGDLGTGIGLALAKGIVASHHGRIEVLSKEGEGSCFSVLIPLGSGHFEAQAIIPEFKDSEAIDPYLSSDAGKSPTLESPQAYPLSLPTDEPPSRILVVDDNPDIRAFIRSLLEGQHQVQEATNGKEAFDMIKADPPDLIVSDVMMPIMDGIELCHRLKTDMAFSHIPLILLTARTSLIFQVRGYETGADDYITKPFNAQLLLARVNNLIRSRSFLRKSFGKAPKILPEEYTHNQLDAKFLEKCMAVVTEHLDDDTFTVEQFTHEMGLSRSYFHRKLKAITNQSASEFIRTLRLKKALEFLSEGEWTISEVAYKVGFSSLSYFNRCFRNQFEQTPTEYLNKSFPSENMDQGGS